MQIGLDQLKHPAIAHALLDALHKPRMPNRIEVAPQVGIHHKGVALSKQPVHFAKRIFAAKTQAKTITHLKKLPLKDGLQHKLKRRLYDAVFNYRYPQGTKLASPLGNLHPPHRHRPVASPLQRYAQLLQIHLRPCRKPLDALTVHSRCSTVRRYLLPGCFKRSLSVHFVDQAEPLTSFDAVFQRRQHALVPHRSFHPPPISSVGFCALCSHLWHSRRLAFALLRHETHASTFLSPFPRCGFASRPSRGFHRSGTIETLTPAQLTHCAGLPAYCATPSCRSVSNHVGCLVIASPTTPA